MITNRLIAMVLAAALTVSYIPCSRAEDAPPTQSGPDGGSIAAAAVSDIIYVPGKTVSCASSGILWFVAMSVTLGSCYKNCGDFVHDACTGKWVLRGEDMSSIPESSQPSMQKRDIWVEIDC
jgi:hypothetical protein